jgi:hypothetical protein
MKVKNILITAEEATSGKRQEDYGSPEDSFKDIADLWSAYIGYPFSPIEVAHMMILLKVARNGHAYKEDNCVDIAGYARTIQMIVENGG